MLLKDHTYCLYSDYCTEEEPLHYYYLKVLALRSVAFLYCFYKHLISSYFTDLDDEDLNEETGEFIRSLPTSGLEGSMVL